jgi:predicted amidohydrolase
MEYLDSYEVACIQSTVKVVASNDPKEQDAKITKNLKRIQDLIEWTYHQTNGRCKLCVTAEYALTGTYRPRTIKDWLNLALPIPNQYTEQLGETAKQFGCYIATQLMEKDPNFPGVFFDTAFIIDPQGKVVLRYRKHNGPNNLNVQYLGPGDIYDKYVQVYGQDQLFPVIDTPLGKLGCFICYDINFPEVTRCLTLNGAEVLLHLSAGTLTLAQHWDELKVARAWENAAYLVSAEAGPREESRWPTHIGTGRSMVVSYDGNIINQSNGPGERVVTAEINLQPLRNRRMALNPHQINPYSQLRASLYAEEYRRAQAWPINAWAERPMGDREEAMALGGKILDSWADSGKLVRPRK